MTEDQKVILGKVVKGLGMNVLHLKDDIGETFHVGQIHLPTDGQMQTISFRGYDATHIFTTMRRDMSAGQLQSALDDWSMQVGTVGMRFPLVSTWRLYSA
jgi:hypothetical protein